MAGISSPTACGLFWMLLRPLDGTVILFSSYLCWRLRLSPSTNALIGIDSVALTYVLMGPLMAAFRAMGAVASAVAVGLLVAGTPSQDRRKASSLPAECCGDAGCEVDSLTVPEASSLSKGKRASAAGRTFEGLRYAFRDVLKDIGPWMLLGTVIAGGLITWIPAESLASFGSGWKAMLFMAIVGIPLYLCAQAATPIAAAMIVAGISPGTALVFLLAAPMTSFATLTILRREFGLIPVMVFTLAIAGTAVAAGLILDFLASYFALNVVAHVGVAEETFPSAVRYTALAVLCLLMLMPAPEIG